MLVLIDCIFMECRWKLLNWNLPDDIQLYAEGEVNIGEYFLGLSYGIIYFGGHANVSSKFYLHYIGDLKSKSCSIYCPPKKDIKDHTALVKMFRKAVPNTNNYQRDCLPLLLIHAILLIKPMPSTGRVSLFSIVEDWERF